MELKEKCKFVRKTLKKSQKKFAENYLETNQTEVSFIERGFIPKDKIINRINNLYNQITEANRGKHTQKN